MDDYRDLIKTLENQILTSDAEGVSEQRSRNHEYYTMQPLGNERKGRSHYVSPDVFDAVESAKAMFSSTFFNGRRVVRFKPGRAEHYTEATKRTEYVNLQLESNNWTELFRDGWHDAFVAKRMVMHADWKKKEGELTIEVEGANAQQLGMMIQAAQVEHRVLDVKTEELAQSFNPQLGPIYSGPLKLVLDQSHVCLYLIQPECFFRDPLAAYASESSYCTWEMNKNRYELIEMGFDPEQVASLKQEYRIRASDEDSSRKSHDSSYSSRFKKNGPKSQGEVVCYKTCTWLTAADILGDGDETEKSGLYEIWWSHGEVLTWADGTPAIKEIDIMPFFEWTEFKVSHAEHGMAVSDVISHTQKVQSVLKRLIIDNQQMRNTSRYEAVHGAIKNPRDLLDNQIGGVVWSRQIGSVAPLATPELSPLTLSAIEMLAKDSEARSGFSALSKGMNQDAISSQNAADMIERLTNAGNRRVMRAARDFATTFMVPLFRYIYLLGARNDSRVYTTEVNGVQTEIRPSHWNDSDVRMAVQIALTPEECQRHAQALMMMHTTMKDDPAMAVMYGAPQRHAMFEDIFDALGVPDASRYLMRPDSPEYQQAMQAQQQKEQMVMQKQLEGDQLQKQLAISDDKRKWAETQQKQKESEEKAEDRAYDNIRQDDALAWQKRVDIAELTLEKENAENDKVSEIRDRKKPPPFRAGSPNG